MRLYVSSKIDLAGHWRRLRTRLPITSTWIDVGREDATHPHQLDALWTHRIVPELIACTHMMVYLRPTDVPKGMLAEMGVAFGRGIPVAIVMGGSNRETELRRMLGTWVYMSNVRDFATIREALRWLATTPHPRPQEKNA